MSESKEKASNMDPRSRFNGTSMRGPVKVLLFAGFVVATMSFSGCLAPDDTEGQDEQGIRLTDRTICGGNFTDGTPVHCEQGAAEALVRDEVPTGWVQTYGPQGEHDSTFYRSVDPSGPPGTFRLGYSYQISRGPIDPEISLDPVHGLTWHVSWDRPVTWETGESAFVEFPEPVPHGEGEFWLLLFHPHNVAMNTSLFNAAIDTPALHDKRVEPLWQLYEDETRVVHKVHGDGGPYYFHSGQPETGSLGYGLAQRGLDYHISIRLIVLDGMSFPSPP